MITNFPRKIKTPICQQELRACHPTFDHKPARYYVFALILFAFITFILFIFSKDVIEYKVQYDHLCIDGNTTQINFTIDK